jgi:hypothetical protein
MYDLNADARFTSVYSRGVSLNDLLCGGEEKTSETSKKNCNDLSLQLGPLFALFCIFMFVVSDVFVQNVVSNFSGSLDRRNPTACGTVVQGIFLVIFYSTVTTLIARGLI